jgi:hypothetical protein
VKYFSIISKAQKFRKINFGSLIINKILKNSPRLESCGTSDSMGKGAEDFPKVRTKENLDDE